MSKMSKRSIIIILFSSILIFNFAGCEAKKSAASDNNNAFKIQYLGHSAFVFSDQKKTKIGIDFWSPEVNYYAEDRPSELGITEKDNLTALLISHEHEDHNYVPKELTSAQSKLNIIRGITNYDVIENPKVAVINNTIIGRYKSFHESDSELINVGDDAVFVINMNNVKMAHLGDGFGAMADKAALEKLKKKIGDIDILFMPIGINPREKVDQEELENTITILDPKIVVPMHYFKMEQKKQFLSDMKKANYIVEDINVNYKTISKSDLQRISTKVIWSIKPSKYSN